MIYFCLLQTFTRGVNLILCVQIEILVVFWSKLFDLTWSSLIEVWTPDPPPQRQTRYRGTNWPVKNIHLSTYNGAVESQVLRSCSQQVSILSSSVSNHYYNVLYLGLSPFSSVNTNSLTYWRTWPVLVSVWKRSVSCLIVRSYRRITERNWCSRKQKLLLINKTSKNLVNAF